MFLEYIHLCLPTTNTEYSIHLCLPTFSTCPLSFHVHAQLMVLVSLSHHSSLCCTMTLIHYVAQWRSFIMVRHNDAEFVMLHNDVNEFYFLFPIIYIMLHNDAHSLCCTMMWMSSSFSFPPFLIMLHNDAHSFCCTMMRMSCWSSSSSLSNNDWRNLDE